MECDICRQNQATITIKKIINGVHSEIHLCESCAKNEAISMGGKFDFPEFIKGVLNMQSEQSSQEKAPQFPSGYNMFAPDKKLVCTSCGYTLGDFRRTAKLGCEDCYSVFEKVLEPLIKKMHGRTVHTGKIAHSAGEDILRKREISDIQVQLRKAIDDENYELAAEYRDMIKLLKTSSAEGEE